MDGVLVALRVLLSLAVVLGLIWVLRRRLDRGARARIAANPVTVVGRQNVGQKASVVIVDVAGQRFLLGVTDQQVNVLHQADAPAPATEEEFAVAMSGAVAAAGSDSARKTAAHAVPRGSMLGSALSGSALSGSALSTSPLGGSILSPAAWKQTAAALRRFR